MRKVLATLVLLSSAASSLMASWVYESTTTWNNQYSTPDDDTQYVFTPGYSTNTTYWYSASSVSFTSTGWSDSNGSATKRVGLKFEFSKPIVSFEWVTPKMNNHIVAAGNEVLWKYSTNGTDWTTLWSADTGGATVSFPSQATPEQFFTAEDNVTKIWLTYELLRNVAASSYGGQVVFDTSTSALTVTTVPEPLTVGLIAAGSIALLRRKRQ